MMPRTSRRRRHDLAHGIRTDLDQTAELDTILQAGRIAEARVYDDVEGPVE